MKPPPFIAVRAAWAAAAIASLACFSIGPARATPPDFTTKVAPILAARCGACHAAGDAESGFRIDDRGRAFAGGDSGTAGIVPGKPAESEVYTRIVSEDEDSRMPANAAPLSAEEREVIKSWIETGAPWPDAMQSLAALLPKVEPARPKGDGHWAFQAVVRPPVPDVAPPRSNPIDAFIAAGLAAKQLTFNPEADPRTLMRRVHFDLIGLPPEPDELDTFEAACAARGIDGPYRELVDRLLASPHYGERWARHWLDVVRFAESNGFEMNRIRENAWPYRDWVIESLNADMPYDEFVRKQLCGDMLGADAATGFLVAGPKDMVTSPDPVLTANQRADELHDIVSTTATAFLGLSVGCARCHEHKFDPIPQADYYRFKAVFAGIEHGERPLLPPDNAARLERIAAVKRELEEPGRRLDAFKPVASLRRTIVIDDAGPGRDLLVPATDTVAHADGGGRGEAGRKGSLFSLPDIGRKYQWWGGVTATPVIAYAPKAEGLFRIWISWGAGWQSHARDARYLLDADGNPGSADDQQVIATVDQRLFADGTGEPPPDRPLWSEFRDAGVHRIGPKTRLLVAGGDSAASVTADTVLFEEVDRPDAPAGTVPHLRSKVTSRENVDRFSAVTARFLRFTIRGTNNGEPCIDELTVLSTDGREVSRSAKPSASGSYEGNASHKLEHINDGRLGNERSWISNEVGGGWVQFEFAQPVEIDRVIWSRDRSDNPRFKDRVATRYEIAVSDDGDHWRPVATDVDRLPFDYPYDVGPIATASRITSGDAAEAQQLAATVSDLEQQLASLETLPKSYAGRFVTPDKVHRSYRGDPMQPREEVPPGSLSSFPAAWHLPADAPEQDRRRALADWIAAPGHPLTARVIANRLWHYHFGTGIVDTPSDFGVNGGQPSHPALLDWLASELIAPATPRDRWRLKPLHRQIVTSRTYRQSSNATPAGLVADSGSRLLWRFPPRRLEAEPLRDTILAVSGSLNRKMGGPGFDLFEPNTNYVKVYATKTSFTDDDFRRMVYQAKPRSELDSFFGAFDCPDAGQIQPKRTVSTTPLQALNMLNGEFLLDQAARFAARVEKEAGGDAAAQAARAIELAFGRKAAADEITAAVALVQAHGLPILCRSLYNANEFITVY